MAGQAVGLLERLEVQGHDVQEVPPCRFTQGRGSCKGPTGEKEVAVNEAVSMSRVCRNFDM